MLDNVRRVDVLNVINKTYFDFAQYREQRNLILALPSAERRGKWVVDGLDHRGGIDWMHCSVCGCRRVNVPMDHTPYCPYCGAKME
ncbi:MAG: hypothetical protein IKF39_01795 [Oscillospiraceae bacterium]|nr:hypothetical protein [Oscillospiraceae bacterium]